MADSPIDSAPVPAAEKPILDQLLLTRDKLLLLKENKATYVKSSDIQPLYGEVLEQIKKLNEVQGADRLVQNRTDSVLDDCLQLVSLFFMATGRNNEIPALYSMASNIRRLCEHLKEAAFYSTSDLVGMEKTVAKMEHAVLQSEADGTNPPYIIERLKYRLQVCKDLIHELSQYVSTLTPEEAPTWDKLVSILRAISALNIRSKFNMKDLHELREHLLKIRRTIPEKDLPDEEGNMGLFGKDRVVTLLIRCLYFCDLVEQRKGKIDSRFKDIYDQLIEIRNRLDQMNMTQAWSLRETDLFMWQRKLDRIDASRRDGNFFDSEGHGADKHTQRTLLYLIRKSYSLIYELLVASEPVSEALQPVFNQLSTLKKCLVDVRDSGGVSSPRELYPYSMKLNSIDKMRVNGVFKVGKDIPEGQSSVNELLAECFEIANDIRKDAVEAAKNNGVAVN